MGNFKEWWNKKAIGVETDALEDNSNHTPVFEPLPEFSNEERVSEPITTIQTDVKPEIIAVSVAPDKPFAELEVIPEQSIKRTIFFDTIRTTLFGGHLTELQVSGMDMIFKEWERIGNKDIRQIAYILATVFWECDKKMQPIREYGLGKGHSYGIPDKQTGQIYYGRGFVQLTHKYNYEIFSDLLKVDLVNKPDLALEINIATQILFTGMIKGLFTGKKLSDYFNDKTDWYNSRRIINILDHAKDIEKIAIKFYAAL